jgi:hypothetical protein
LWVFHVSSHGLLVIVENRPGAGNTIGAAAVARAEPDGYTLLFANTSVSANPSLFKSLPYDTAQRSCAGRLPVAIAQRAAGAAKPRRRLAERADCARQIAGIEAAQLRHRRTRQRAS